MLDIKAIRKNPASFQKSLQRKGVDGSLIDKLLEIDKSKLTLSRCIEDLKSEQNKVSKEIIQLSGAEKDRILVMMKNLSKKKKELEEEFVNIEKTWQAALESLPNPPHDEAPDGASDEENVVIKKFGEQPNFDFKPLEHWELAEKLQILDTKRSAKVSGARFYYLRNELAILQQALMLWALQKVRSKGFSATIPPFMTRKKAIQGTGFFDKDENYVVNPDEEELYLIGTSEVPMTSFYADEILDEGDFTEKFVSYSPCFRREAGTYGKDTKGIFRVHQFEKVEMVVFCLPEQSSEMHEMIREIEEEILQDLGIHYQVVNVCCGDLGNSAVKKYDLEAWLPGQGKYREMTSTSICTDFQSRRLNIRIRRKNGEIVLAHTLNGTATSSRPLVAILENFQQADGSILIPKCLQPLCGFDKISLKKD
jgi:seryl-tRNA synthetase